MKSLASLFVFVVSVLPVVSMAQVTPVSGMTSPNSNNPLPSPAWTILATGGDVVATVGGFDFGGAPGFTNGLANVNTNTSLGTNYPTPSPSSFDLGSFAAGTELVFSLTNPNQQTFYSGDASRNFDGQVHANVYNTLDVTGAPVAVVDFEDVALGNGPDWNYGDAKIQLTNAQAVPEPISVALLGCGLFAVVRRRR
jgi:hypothetical protein